MSRASRSAQFAAAATMCVFLTGCGLEIVDPKKPPRRIPTALLYLRPKEQFWVVCKSREHGVQKCDFYNPDGNSIVFRCQYRLKQTINQGLVQGAWLGADRELKLEKGDVIACEDREDAPSDHANP